MTGSASTAVLLMSDVAGSTRLWERHPAEMNAVMARHHVLVYAVIAAHGGWRPVDQGEGDAVFAAFDSALAAMSAARDIQQALAAESWPVGISVAVRMGIHAGDVVARGGNLFGVTVNRCARLRGLGAGGQVLLSAPIYELVRDALPAGLGLTDLGEHRMKDLARPEHVYQLDIAGLSSDFPPLASLDRAAHNLPIQMSSFLGRHAEISELVHLVRHERLVSIVGFGGMGKTRLALQVAAEIAGDSVVDSEADPAGNTVADIARDGVRFVDLSAVRDAAQIPTLIAAALGIGEGGDGILAAVKGALAGKRLLLVLDNVEQLLPGAAAVVDGIVRAGPGVRVLTTTREPLRLGGERQYLLSPLPVPPLPRDRMVCTAAELESLSTYDAVRLFIRRASAVRHGFTLIPANAAAIAGICDRVDGMPLALELAAARIRVLSPEMLLPRLDHALTVLTGGSRDLPTRQQTLRATIAWSYDTLDHTARTLLDRLSIFPGSFTLSAAEAVCGAALDPGEHDLDVLDGISTLVDHTLLTHHPATDADAEDRYDLLVSIREFAGERLTSGSTAALADRHAAYYAAVSSFPADFTRDDEDRIDRVRHHELHQLRAALAHSRAHGSAAQEMRLVVCLAWELIVAGLSREFREMADHAVNRVEVPSLDQASLLITRAYEAAGSAPDEARTAAHRAIGAARKLGEPSVLVHALAGALVTAESREEYNEFTAEAEALLVAMPARGTHLPIWRLHYDWDTATHMSPLTTPSDREAALRRQLIVAGSVDRPRIASNLAGLLCWQSRWAEARVLLAPFEVPAAAVDVEPFMHVGGLLTAIDMRLALGELAAAGADLELADSVTRGLGQLDVHFILGRQRAALDRLVGDLDSAADRLAALMTDNSPPPGDLAWTRRLLAVVRREQGRPDEAVSLLAQAFTMAVELRPADVELTLLCLLERAVQIGADQPEVAARLLGLAAAHGPESFAGDAAVRYDLQAITADLRDRLGRETFEELFGAGRTAELPITLG